MWIYLIHWGTTLMIMHYRVDVLFRDKWSGLGHHCLPVGWCFSGLALYKDWPQVGLYKTGPVHKLHTHQQLAVGDMTMSGWKPTISLIHPSICLEIKFVPLPPQLYLHVCLHVCSFTLSLLTFVLTLVTFLFHKNIEEFQYNIYIHI